jgi:hypothetical protein
MRIVRIENMDEVLVTVDNGDGTESLKIIHPTELRGCTVIPPEPIDPMVKKRVEDWEWACGPLPKKPNHQCTACIWDRYLTTETGKNEAARRPNASHTCPAKPVL